MFIRAMREKRALTLKFYALCGSDCHDCGGYGSRRQVFVVRCAATMMNSTLCWPMWRGKSAPETSGVASRVRLDGTTPEPRKSKPISEPNAMPESAVTLPARKVTVDAKTREDVLSLCAGGIW